MLLKHLKPGRLFEYMDKFYFKTDKENMYNECTCMNYPSGTLKEIDSSASISVVKYNLTISDISES